MDPYPKKWKTDENGATFASPTDSVVPVATTWSAGVAGLGFLETSYLNYLKLTGSEAFCPVAGGGCGNVLESDYSIVFGIPLPLLGLAAYGLVTALSLQENGKKFLSGLDELDIRLTLLLISTSMATASAYFLYILSTKFIGTSCSYCVLSAFLSTLFFIKVKDFGLERIQKLAGLQLAVALIVALALTNSYSLATTQLKGMKCYNGCLFHKVEKDFLAQTGDPTGSGAGGDSIYKFNWHF
ncbi:hypothetical protein GUJ93_ZPchr0004g38970 [Zizania palustris]|uniref:Vitamin K epoxide reductase domain-containing protein n=1 Tax=Zizania palustris TaxID=103762 RepID=A0A8J5T081_ZIZPA|nr:hypothetical protein GUJ93_ZPchr0004g38970 [Zizania palustris]